MKLYDFDTPTNREATNAEKYQKRQKLFGTNAVYPMWVADMEFATAPCVVDALQAQVEHKVFGYEEPSIKHYKACAAWLKNRYEVEVKAQNIRMSPSIMTTMSAAIQALSNKGEGVTVLTPVYTPFLTTVKQLKRTLFDVKLLEDFTINTKAFEQSMQQSRLLLLCNPHNPVGKLFSDEELAYIIDIAHKNDVIIISDDAHADIVRIYNHYIPIVNVDEKAHSRSVVLGGVGKGFNVSGLGATYYYSFEPTLLARIDEVFNDAHIIRANALGLSAMYAAFSYGHEWLNDLNLYIDNNVDYAVEHINSNCQPLKVVRPKATYLLWIDCRGLDMSDKALKEFFVQEVGIGLSLGRLFGKGGSQFMRMNVAVPFSILKAVMQSLEDALKRKV